MVLCYMILSFKTTIIHNPHFLQRSKRLIQNRQRELNLCPTTLDRFWRTDYKQSDKYSWQIKYKNRCLNRYFLHVHIRFSRLRPKFYSTLEDILDHHYSWNFGFSTLEINSEISLDLEIVQYPYQNKVIGRERATIQYFSTQYSLRHVSLYPDTIPCPLLYFSTISYAFSIFLTIFWQNHQHYSNPHKSQK